MSHIVTTDTKLVQGFSKLHLVRKVVASHVRLSSEALVGAFVSRVVPVLLLAPAPPMSLTAHCFQIR